MLKIAVKRRITKNYKINWKNKLEGGKIYTASGAQWVLFDDVSIIRLGTQISWNALALREPKIKYNVFSQWRTLFTVLAPKIHRLSFVNITTTSRFFIASESMDITFVKSNWDLLFLLINRTESTDHITKAAVVLFRLHYQKCIDCQRKACVYISRMFWRLKVKCTAAYDSDSFHWAFLTWLL